MAKESKKKSSSKVYEVGPWLLFFIATGLLVAGWLMRSFPVLIFAAISPLFAIADKTHAEDKFWNYAELILIALTLSLLAGHIFQLSFLISSMIQAIGFTLAFVGYGFVHQSLGPKAGKFTIIIFWLAIEYLFLKLQWPMDNLFLADAVQLKTSWLNWTFYTGYLGSSLWILVTNLFFYLAILKEGRIQWAWLTVSFVFLVGPIIYSFSSDVTGMGREEMISLYSTSADDMKSIYSKRGEFVPRTAAWISVLIIIFAMVKNKTQKK